MKTTEAAALLTVAAAFDNRKPDADQAKAWALALDGYRFEDCRDAIVAHYRGNREWIMPSDVIAAVRKLRAARLMEHPPVDPPSDLDPSDPDDPEAYSRWLIATRRAIADGRDPQAVEYVATRQIGDLGHVLRALPSADVKPAERTAEHDAALDRARAELAARRPVPMPDVTRESEETDA